MSHEHCSYGPLQCDQCAVLNSDGVEVSCADYAAMNAALQRSNMLNRPPVEWDALTAELRERPEEMRLSNTVCELEALAERAARLARYLDTRHGGGCGDQGHAAAVKAQNKAGRIVHEKAFGYNATHDIKV